LKMKLKSRQFDTIKGIEAELQAVLNTTSRMRLQNCRSAGNGAYALKKTVSSVMMANRPKVSLWSDDSTSLRNYGWLFV
jgi:hypothetical protein